MILNGIYICKVFYIVFVVEKLQIIFMHIHNAVLYILGFHTPYDMGVSHATAIIEMIL